jgi:hypothetical protein
MDVDAQPMAKTTENEGRSTGRRIALHKLLPVLLAAGLLWTVPPDGSARQADDSATTETEPDQQPIVMRDFEIFINEEGRLREKVTAQVAYLYQRMNIIHMLRIHVDSENVDPAKKYTVDAPEGYLYLDNVTLTKKHPIFQEIGGEDAITTETFRNDQKTTEVLRGEKDIDVLGRYGSRVILRWADGTVVSALRAYRDDSQRMMYGLGSCEMKRPQFNKETGKRSLFVVVGETFEVIDDFTSGVNVRGRGGMPPQIRVEPL